MEWFLLFSGHPWRGVGLGDSFPGSLSSRGRALDHGWEEGSLSLCWPCWDQGGCGPIWGRMVKNLPPMKETQVHFLGQKEPLEESTATHSRCSCLENPTDRGAGQAAVHGVTKSHTRLSD